MDYKLALYRRNNKGEPTVWYAEKNTISYEYGIIITHGIVGKKLTTIKSNTSRDIDEEIKSLIKAKRKIGYKFLNELRDNCELPVEGQLLEYLRNYLPYDRTGVDNNLLPMLAKTYDNSNNKLFNKGNIYLGQYKINGLRCFIRAEKGNSLFSPYHLIFTSREGIVWNSLYTLETKLLSLLPEELINDMIENNFILDGELYIPGYTINDINSFIKTPTRPENGLIQFWCYDIAMDDLTYLERRNYLNNQLGVYTIFYEHKNEHFKSNTTLKLLGDYDIFNDLNATSFRDTAIDLGFEGCILRNPNASYQYGKRNQSMIKYKKHTDGVFEIIDIYPEGVKRPDIPLFLCMNDINNEVFECHIGGTLDYQKEFLKNKDNYIGRKLFIEYGERSGINQLPFHIKTVKLYNEH